MKLKLSDSRVYEIDKSSRFVPRVYTWEENGVGPDSFVLSLYVKDKENKPGEMDNVITWFYGARSSGGILESSPNDIRGILKRIYEDQPCP